LCLVPNGDLFEAIKGGRVDVVTDQIETFTRRASRCARASSSQRI
jgi:cation diffusion facilitator CzcD-associated flavoprotein CzcO